MSRYDRYMPGEGYDDLRRLIERKDPGVVIQIVGHYETVEELDNLREWLADECNLAARFDGTAIDRLTSLER